MGVRYQSAALALWLQDAYRDRAIGEYTAILYLPFTAGINGFL